MTAPLLPQHMLKILEAEFQKTTWTVVEKLCDCYALNKEEVRQRMQAWMYTELDIQSDEKVKVIKTKTKTEVPLEERCIARFYNKDVKDVTQCSKRAKKCGFCMMHYDLSRQDYLRYGTIHKPIQGYGPNFNVVKKVDRVEP